VGLVTINRPVNDGDTVDITTSNPYQASATLASSDVPLLMLYQIDNGDTNSLTPSADTGSNPQTYTANFNLTTDDCPDPSTAYVLTVYGWDATGALSTNQRSFNRSSAT
jgi:hypothetical protein